MWSSSAYVRYASACRYLALESSARVNDKLKHIGHWSGQSFFFSFCGLCFAGRIHWQKLRGDFHQSSLPKVLRSSPLISLEPPGHCAKILCCCHFVAYKFATLREINSANPLPEQEKQR